MRVVVTGATGNLGSSVLDALVSDSSVGSVLGVARRVPDAPAVHARDVAEACRLALTSEVRGPFNLAADPVLDSAELGRVLGARPVTVPELAPRIGADVSWRLRLQPTPPGWVDLARRAPPVGH